MAAALRSWSRVAAAAALASFLAASLAARSRAETERVERLAFRVSGHGVIIRGRGDESGKGEVVPSEYNRSCISG